MTHALNKPDSSPAPGKALYGGTSSRRITVRAQWPRGASYYARNNWAGRLRVGSAWVLDSPVNNAFAHFLMLALFWAGDTPTAASPPESLISSHSPICTPFGNPTVCSASHVLRSSSRVGR